MELSEDQKRVLWFIKVRWAAILTMTAVVLSSVLLGDLQFPLLPPLLIIGLGAAYNGIFPFLVMRYEYFASSDFMAYLRMLSDILVVTLLVHYTGGVESIFVLLYVLEVSSVAMFGFQKLAYAMSAHAALFYAVACKMESMHIIPHYGSVPVPGQLFLSDGYIFNRAAALFFISCMMVFMSSYLTNRLREKQRQVEALTEEKSDFVNTVAHELKSPLTSIQEYASLALEGVTGQLNDAQRKSLEVIKKQSKRIGDMVNDLLDLARIEAQKDRLEMKPVSISNVIDNALTEMRPQFELSNVKLEEQIEEGLPCVMGNEDKVLEVIINLFSNAIKFSEAGQTVTISARPAENRLEVTVSDQGLGIDPKDMGHIFDKFYRASKESSQRKGTGLGLALSRRIIELHGGRMWAESPGPGKGSAFRFTLPFK